jgi:Zn-finger nucleic acid-binding protein
MEVKMEKKLKCPRCKEFMDKLTNGKYIIDKCPSCKGIWLDKDEIVRINKQGLISYIADYFRRDAK